MSADERVLLNVADAILGGQPVDWPTLTANVSDSQRAVFEDLKAIAAIGSLSRRHPSLPILQAPALPSGSTWGQLRLLEPIGRGSFGIVYRAWDPRLDREVALKLLPADEQALNALDEGRRLAKVHHPNVVTIFGADQIGSFVGLWMELVRGDTLEQMLTREGVLRPDRAAEIGRQLCHALSAVHAAGLMHRDVKAHNVMLDLAGRVVLMDFGAGRFRSDADGAMAGTPLYLAPEIFDGAPATEQSDIYSAAVLLYHLLTARYPIPGKTLREIRHERSKGIEIPDLRVLRPDVPRRLAHAIERALAQRPAERFHSAGAFAQALAQPTTAPPRITELAVLLVISVGVIAVVAGGGRFPRGTGGGQKPANTVSPAPGAPDAPSTRRFSLPGGALAGSGLSYDGRYFSFIDDHDNLAVTDMSSGLTETMVQAAGEQFPEFSIMSPNGGQAAYQWMTSRNSYELRAVDRLTKAVRVLLRDDSLDYPLPIQWSRDGTFILVWSKTLQGGGRIAQVNVRSGGVSILRDVTSGEPFGLSISPDGRYVAYDLPLSSTRRGHVLHILDVATHEDRVVTTEDSANDRFPLWTPAGSHLFFISDRSGMPDGWILPVENGRSVGEPSLLVRNLGRVSSLGMTAAGAFYYSLAAGVFEVNQIALDPASGAFLSPPSNVAKRFAGSNIAPSYAPDGMRLAYVSVRDSLGGRGRRTIVIKNLRTGEETDLDTPLDVGNMPPRWSPDGRHLVLLGVDRSGRRAAHVLDAQSGAIVHEFNPAADRELGDYGPMRWAVDGKSIFYEYVNAGLMKHSLDGSPDTVVYPYSSDSQLKRIHRAEVSPDGNLIALSGSLRNGRGSVLHVIAPGGELEIARRDPPEMIVVQGWSPDSTAVFFTTLNTNLPPPHELWRVSARGGEARRLGSLPSATQYNPISINPNGSAVAYTAGTPERELWVMENFLPKDY